MYYNLHVETFTLAPVYTVYAETSQHSFIFPQKFLFFYFIPWMKHSKDKLQRISSKETYQGTESQQTP